MNKNKKCVWRYRIYALITRGGLVYIGKTMGKKMSAVYRHHTKGRCDHTRKTIGQAGEGTQMHVLEEIEACTSIAYRHVIAWIHIFLCEGYRIVNQPGMIEDAEDLHQETKQLAEDLLRVPLAERLLSSRLVRLADADLPYERSLLGKQVASAGPEMNTAKVTAVQMNLRFTAQEKDMLCSFAKRMSMTQRDAVMYLLRKGGKSRWGTADWWEDQCMLRSQRQVLKTNEKLKEEIIMLEARLEKAKTDTPESQAPKMTARFHQVQELVRQYFGEAKLETMGSLPLRRLGYKRFVQGLPSGVGYEYPKDEGMYTFQPEAILYGESRPPVHFWVGKMEDGSSCKLRVYEKWDYVGVYPMHKDYSVRGMQWLIQVRRGTDGAMDLIAALPLGNAAKVVKQDKKVSLAQRIADIEGE